MKIIEREIGSGTRDIIYQKLKPFNINRLNRVLTLNSTEAIKNYLYHSDHFAFISIHAITDDLLMNKLKTIEIKDVKIERWFYLVSRTGYKFDIMNNLERFIKTSYNL